MKKTYTLYLIHILLLVLSSSFLKAEDIASYHFSRLSPSNGLSQMTITAIHQDRKGYLWFGTRNGLNRYNGYNFTTFETSLNNTNSLSNNAISSISEDSKGNLWIGTFDGLNMLNPTTNEITRYQSVNDNEQILSSNIIYALHYDSENTLWIGTGKGLDKYNLATNTFEPSFLGDLLKNETINCIFRQGSELFIGTTHKGLIVYNIQNKTHTQISTQSKTPISDNNVKSVFIDSNQNLWVGTYSSGINVISKDRKQTLVYNKANGLTDNHIRDFAEMSNGNIVVATFNGLDAIEHKTRKVSRYKNYDLNKGGLSHYSIISLLYDKDHTLWVGTYAGGVNYYNSSENKFTYFNPQQMLNTTVGIMADIQEVDDYIYIASEGKGLLEMNKITQEIKYYRLTTNSDDDFAHNILKSLFWDGITLYCGTNLGMIYTFDIRSKQYQKYFDFEKHNSIYYIGKDGDGSLVVGGVNDVGFSIITKEKKLINSFFI